MAAAAVLHVGDDFCHRIPVLERNGVLVLRTECSVVGVRGSFAKGDLFSAVTFHNDVLPPLGAVVSTVRELSRAPLILFRNPTVDCDERPFDLVIDVDGTPPAVWSKTLREAIEESRKLREKSQQLCQDCAALGKVFQELRETISRNLVSPVDYDALFRREGTKADDEGGNS